MSLKDKIWQPILNVLHTNKNTLMMYWNIGAEEGKRLQRKHSEKLRREKDEKMGKT